QVGLRRKLLPVRIAASIGFVLILLAGAAWLQPARTNPGWFIRKSFHILNTPFYLLKMLPTIEALLLFAGLYGIWFGGIKLTARKLVIAASATLLLISLLAVCAHPFGAYPDYDPAYFLTPWFLSAGFALILITWAYCTSPEATGEGAAVLCPKCGYDMRG